jgi:glycerol-3-phosphate O-acyltransferase
LAGPARSDLRAELADWLDVFYAEFFVPRGEVMAAHFDAFLDHFERLGWIERRDGETRATEKGMSHLAFLAEQTRGVVEVYYATFAAVSAMDVELGRKALMKIATDQFARANLVGEVECPESVNDTTIANAIALLVDRGVLALGAEPGKKSEVPYVRGPSFGDLVPMRERLASVLSAR